MALLEVRTEWAVYKDCFLQVARYQADNSRAIEIWNNEDGPIARITVCIAGSGLAEDETVIDTNNCPWAMELIKQHGFGQATGRMVRSGYCTYPAVKLDDDTYMVQEFDNELVFMGELWSGCKYPDEVIDWMKSNYEIESCLTAEVYRSSLGDCTNNGISSYTRELYILDAQKGPFEPDDIRQCVYIEKREIMGQEYVDCKPAYCRKRWYMAGGNILYTSDSRFKQITGISYPIAIHDRYEGR